MYWENKLFLNVPTEHLPTEYLYRVTSDTTPKEY